MNQQFISVQGSDTAALYIPNAFTPNGDGINDIFLPFGRNIAIIKCQLYDNGQEIYELDSMGQYWDGAENGQFHVKVYTLKISCTSTFGTSFNSTGTVSLISGAFFGDTARNITLDGHVYLNISKAQFPDQNSNGLFNPNSASGEFLNVTEVNDCD